MEGMASSEQVLVGLLETELGQLETLSEEQLLARIEPVMNHRRGDPSCRGDLPDCRVGDASLSKQRDGGIQQSLTAIEMGRTGAPAGPGNTVGRALRSVSWVHGSMLIN